MVEPVGAPPPPTPIRYKQPGEARTLTFEFADKLNAGDAVNPASVGGSVSSDDGVTVSAGQIDGTSRVNSRVSGGTLNQDYHVNCRVTTTQGETLELDVLLLVREGVN